MIFLRVPLFDLIYYLLSKDFVKRIKIAESQ